MDIEEALTLNGLKYFYTKYIKPLKTGAFATVVNNATTTTANTVLDGRMGKTLAAKDANLQSQINKKQDTLYKGNAIQSDFNSIIDDGIYWINPDTTPNNHPLPGRWGQLSVIGSNYYQVFTSYSSVGYTQEATRIFVNGAWTKWETSVRDNVHGIIIASKTGVNVGTSSSVITIPYKCPATPIAIIPHAHGGAPFMCSVNSWTQSQAVISVEAKQNLTNRSVVIAIIY